MISFKNPNYERACQHWAGKEVANIIKRAKETKEFTMSYKTDRGVRFAKAVIFLLKKAGFINVEFIEKKEPKYKSGDLEYPTNSISFTNPSYT